MSHKTGNSKVAIPAGECNINGATYDGSTGCALAGIQEFEQLFLEFIDAQDDVVATTDSSDDLADLVEEAEWVGSLGIVVLDRDVATVRATHLYADQTVGSPEHVHSVMPSCFGAVLLPPTTTTTTTNTTVPLTTTVIESPATVAPTTTVAVTTTTVAKQVLSEVQENPDPDPVVGDPTFTG